MAKLESERVIVAAPMSFTGSAQRIWRMTDGDYNPYVYWLVVIPAAVLAVACAWTIVLCWYAIFGLLLVPYRLIRRSQRNNRKKELRHREVLAQLQSSPKN